MLIIVRLLPLQVLISKQTSKRFKVNELGSIVLTVSLSGCGLIGRMFLFQDLQLSGRVGSVSIAGMVLLPIPRYCCQPALSFYSPMI